MVKENSFQNDSEIFIKIRKDLGKIQEKFDKIKESFVKIR